MHKLYKIPTTVPVLKIKFLLEDYLMHFENQIRLNVGELDYKTNVRGQMTGFKHFLKDEKFNSFMNIFIQKMADIVKESDPLQLKIFNSIQVAEAWGNKLKAGEMVNPHNHIGSLDYASVLYFSATYLVVENQKVDVSRGDVLTFFCTAKHWTDKANEERLSLAFNWRNTTKKNWNT